MMQFLDDPAFDMDAAGNKAGKLHHLYFTNVRVPAGFVIAPDEDVESFPDAVLEQAVERIGGFPVAARSSGRLEDLEDKSFAGLYETFLNVPDVLRLREKILACRRSGDSERVRSYLDGRGAAVDRASVSVLVQPMVDAETAGVAFSIDPLTGREEHALVECCRGLGEGLVTGRTTPTACVIALEDASVIEEKLGSDRARLEPAQVRELTEVLLRIQAHFGSPQDVEWAVDRRGNLWILQSRPITRISWRTDVEAFTDADFRDGGISARVCTPMMFSLYRNAMQASMQAYFEGLKLLEPGDTQRWIAMYYGRAYWNASAVKRSLARVPGFNEEDFDRDLGVQKDYGKKGPQITPTNLRTILRALPVALALHRSFSRQLLVAEDFVRRFPERRRRYLERIRKFETTPDHSFYPHLLEVLFEFHAETERTYFSTIYNNATAQGEFKKFLEKMDRAVGYRSSALDLMTGLSNVRHTELHRGILSLYETATEHGLHTREWEEALEGFLESYGFHSDAELDITVPRWSESPQRVTRMIQDMLESGVAPSDPDQSLGRQQERFRTALSGVNEALAKSWRFRARFARGFRGHLKRVRAYLSKREELRELSTQCYAIVRAYLVEAARRLVGECRLPSESAIFMLSIEELRQLVVRRIAPWDLAERIAFRDSMYRGYRNAEAPNELGAFVTQRTAESHRQRIAGKEVHVGSGCSPGQAEGTARVVTSLDEIHRIRRGDILVTRFTDPGWTPALALVAGVITEVGGVLSHAAVIARESGIPAVLNLPGATRAFSAEPRIRMDGETGVVEILSTGELAEGTETAGIEEPSFDEAKIAVFD